MRGERAVSFNGLEAETKVLSLVMIAMGPPSQRRGASYYIPTLFKGTYCVVFYFQWGFVSIFIFFIILVLILF